MLDLEATFSELILPLPSERTTCSGLQNTGICERNSDVNVSELALSNGIMSNFPHIPCNFNGKFRNEERKVKKCKYLKKGWGNGYLLANICPEQTYSRGMKE